VPGGPVRKPPPRPPARPQHSDEEDEGRRKLRHTSQRRGSTRSTSAACRASFGSPMTGLGNLPHSLIRDSKDVWQRLTRQYEEVERRAVLPILTIAARGWSSPSPVHSTTGTHASSQQDAPTLRRARQVTGVDDVTTEPARSTAADRGSTKSSVAPGWPDRPPSLQEQSENSTRRRRFHLSHARTPSSGSFCHKRLDGERQEFGGHYPKHGLLMATPPADRFTRIPSHDASTVSSTRQEYAASGSTMCGTATQRWRWTRG
jgi:hypothetical protein